MTVAHEMIGHKADWIAEQVVQNQFSLRCGIFSIPTMWLVDKRGNLHDINADYALERRVTALLAEQLLLPNE